MANSAKFVCMKNFEFVALKWIAPEMEQWDCFLFVLFLECPNREILTNTVCLTEYFVIGSWESAVIHRLI